VKNGNTTFQEFIAELQSTASHAIGVSPRSSSPRILVSICSGTTSAARAHVHHRSRRFGGGVVPILNMLAGTPVVAQECQSLDEDDRVRAGGKYLIEAEELPRSPTTAASPGCSAAFHPWMPATVRLK
jgi:hypothetical protein